MKQFNYTISTIEDLAAILNSSEISSIDNFQSLLIQIFSAINKPAWYHCLKQTIDQVFPSAIVVGASAVGEINGGKLLTESTIVVFSFFESTSLKLLSFECKNGAEELVGKSLFNNISSLKPDVKGVLLLATPVSNDATIFFQNFTKNAPTYPIFGGGAGDYANKRKTLVFDGKHCFDQGVVAVAFSGEEIHIKPFTYLGWIPLTKEMTITKVDHLSVKTIDGEPAFSIFKKYLGIEFNDQFFQNVLEFPFLIQRDGLTLARVPFFVNEIDDSIEFLADIFEGEKFRIGYGNPQNIITESSHIQNQMQQFQPQAIFLYSCICRRFLMQKDVELETLPFNTIAPTAGFYTFGEFFSDGITYNLLNSTMVAVGMREEEKKQTKDIQTTKRHETNIDIEDPYDKKHARILSHLLHFINVTIKELEEQNQKLKVLYEQKNEFLGIAAHDLRNPLGIIHGFSELLQEKIGDEYKDYTSMITDTITKMFDLLNDLLDISKIESGKLDLKKSQTNYTELIHYNLKMNEFMASNKNIQVIQDFEDSPLMLSIDPGKMEQVLNNLVGNAIKYSFPGSIIRVKILKEDDRIVTQVIDQGIGIPENEIDNILMIIRKVYSFEF